MKRLGVISFLILALMALLAPVASAHGGQGGHHGGGHDRGGHDRGHHKGHHKGHHHGGGGGVATPTFSATAGSTAPGDAMPLHADVTNADVSVTLTVTAVAHLPTGNISMPLTVKPGTGAFTADGTIGVGGEEPTGPVSVDFTFDYGGTITVITVIAEIQTST